MTQKRSLRLSLAAAVGLHGQSTAKGVTMKARLILLAAVVSVAAAAMAPSASAAGYVGWYERADVTCDPITNKIEIKTHISASTAIDQQRVAFELYLYDATDRTWTRLWAGGYPDPWYRLIHQRVTWSYEWDIARNQYMRTSSISAEAPTPSQVYGPFKDHVYQVWTRYAWETAMNSNVWVDAFGAAFNVNSSPWTQTTGYKRPGNQGYFDACYLR